jgi:hypothetical protein
VTVIDVHTRESLAIRSGNPVHSGQVAGVLADVAVGRDVPREMPVVRRQGAQPVGKGSVTSREDARERMEEWRVEYNSGAPAQRLHRSICSRTSSACPIELRPKTVL